MNPNQTRSKSRQFGIPSWLRTLLFGRNSTQEDDEAELERETDRKKGFWGKRKIHHRKRKLSNAGTSASDQHLTPNLTAQPDPITAPALAVTGEPIPAGKSHEARMPLPHEREEGDNYADEDAEAMAAGARESAVPHPHLFGTHHFDHAVWVKECWEDLRVGDFVRLRGDESVPADLIVCATSEEENVCYVETKNLDGETNLKSRSAVPELAHLRTSTAIEHEAKFIIEAEPADVNMFSYNAAIVLQDGRLGKDGNPLKCPVNLNTVLLRGTVVRNTDWVIGVVSMTGWDTKIVLNSGGTPSKRSKVERLMNPMVLVNLLLLFVMCTMCAIVEHYIELDKSPEGAPWLYGNNRSDDNPQINAVITFVNAALAFQNIVPISLYISIEFVRLIQAFFIWSDPFIVYISPATGLKRRTIARSWNLSDDLGQIEYVFSDKTGTLTQNAMVFRQCSIGGKVYAGDTVTPASEDKNTSISSSDGATRVDSGVPELEKGGAVGDTAAERADAAKQAAADKLSAQVIAEVEADLSKPDSEQAQHVHRFFSNLALCHTVLVAEEDGAVVYKVSFISLNSSCEDCLLTCVVAGVQAQSPDEAALVQAAADAGFTFLGRDKNILRIQTPYDEDVVEYELLNVLEFSSARKRMSVVIRKVGDRNARLLLLSKGADNVIFERLAPGNDQLKKTTDQHLEDFANEGLRTLCLAYKWLDDAEYDQWERQFHQATTLIDNREARIEEVSDQLEQNLILLGATAIEDKLQDGVPEAIADLKRAGLKIWVATGDKLETAIAIAKTCNLLSRDMNIIIIKGGGFNQPQSAYAQIKSALEKFFDAGGLAEQMVNQPGDADDDDLRRPNLNRAQTAVSGVTDIVGQDNGDRPGGYGLVIDGASLRFAFEEPYTKDLLLELATRCRAVVCCRTSPLQKALIVRLVKEGLGSMCLAIGDGANDVSMIQAADIGVGVAGEEGLQAVNSSDYAVGQFRYLQRLLLVHGHWSYMRNANMICNFFYKEIIGIGILFWFQFYCGYSGTTVYEYTYLLFWNVFWTLVPVIGIGIFERNISDKVLMVVPELYEVGRKGKLFGLYRFSIYMLDGIYQSAVIYFFILYAYDSTTARRDGYDVQIYEFSTVMAISAVYAANLYNAFNTRSWTWWIFGGMLIGPFLITVYTAVYAAFPPSLIWTYVWGGNYLWWPSAYFWLGIMFSLVLSFLPRLIWRYCQENYFPTDIEILNIVDKKDPNHDWRHDPYLPQPVAPFDPKNPNPAGHDYPPNQAPAFTRPSGEYGRQSFQLGRITTEQSMTHDMATGESRHGAGRGYGFDEAPAAPASLARYTSRTSQNSANARAQQARPRKGSVRVAGLELNPFVGLANRGSPSSAKDNANRARSGSRLFSLRRGSAVPEEHEEPTSPTRATMSPATGGAPGAPSSPTRARYDPDHEGYDQLE